MLKIVFFSFTVILSMGFLGREMGEGDKREGSSKQLLIGLDPPRQEGSGVHYNPTNLLA